MTLSESVTYAHRRSWAAKEAVFKALQNTDESWPAGRVKFPDISVVGSGHGGGVTVALHGSAREAATKRGVGNLHLRSAVWMCTLLVHR